MSLLDRDTDNSTFGRRLSLAGQLLLLIAVLSLGPLVVTNYVGYERTRGVLERVYKQSLRNAAQVAATDTDHFVEERRQLVTSLVAGNVHLMETSLDAAELVSRGDWKPPGALTPLEEHLRAKAESSEMAADFYVLSSTGQIIGSSEGPQMRGTWRKEDTCLRVAERPAGLGIRHEGASVLFVAEPIPMVGGETAGFFCGRFDFTIYDDLRQLAMSQAPVERFRISDAEGNILSDTAGEQTSGKLAPSLHRHFDPGGVWQGQVERTDEPPVFAAIAPVPSTKWHVVAEVAEGKALVSLHELRRRVFWMGSGFVLVVVLGMFLVVRKTVGPLRDLVDATRDMTRGKLAQEVETRGPREVAELANVFNHMSHHVAELHQTLEERVETRTSELRQNQAFSELLFDSMEENLMVIDDAYRIIKANDAARYTYGPAMVGRSCHEVFGECGQQTQECPAARAFERGEPVEEERVHSCHGHPEIMHMQVFPLPANPSEPPNRVLMVTRPITDEKQERAAASMDEKVSAFALMTASVAHEIGNPLSSISAQLQLARRKDDPAFTERVLDIIDDEVERISGLLRDISEFSSRQSDRQTLVYWNQIATDAVRLLKHEPRGRFADFELDLADDLPPVYAAGDHGLQVLLNLGLNALDAMEGRGKVTIRTRRVDGQVEVRLTDTGPGIAEELRERVFEPYFTTKDDEQGTGLGLFISRRIIEQMDGTLTYEPAIEDGQGASFVICMPEANLRRSNERSESEARPDDRDHTPRA